MACARPFCRALPATCLCCHACIFQDRPPRADGQQYYQRLMLIDGRASTSKHISYYAVVAAASRLEDGQAAKAQACDSSHNFQVYLRRRAAVMPPHDFSRRRYYGQLSACLRFSRASFLFSAMLISIDILKMMAGAGHDGLAPLHMRSSAMPLSRQASRFTRV